MEIFLEKNRHFLIFDHHCLIFCYLHPQRQYLINGKHGPHTYKKLTRSNNLSLSLICSLISIMTCSWQSNNAETTFFLFAYPSPYCLRDGMLERNDVGTSVHNHASNALRPAFQDLAEKDSLTDFLEQIQRYSFLRLFAFYRWLSVGLSLILARNVILIGSIHHSN